MIDKILVKKLYSEGFCQAEIARHMNVTRQYINNIIREYKNSGKKNREKFYKNMGMCILCAKKEAILLHHKDFDNSNDSKSNLEKLCNRCHVLRHLGRPRQMNLRGSRKLPKLSSLRKQPDLITHLLSGDLADE